MRVVSAESIEDPAAGHDPSGDVAALMPMVRRIVLSRVGAHPAAEDLIQETLVRVLAALPRIEPGMLEPYTIVTARNVVATMWRDADRRDRNQHRMVDLTSPEVPDETLLAGEEQAAIAEALGRLDERERDTLLAHEVAGQDTRSRARVRFSCAATAPDVEPVRAARLRVSCPATS